MTITPEMRAQWQAEERALRRVEVAARVSIWGLLGLVLAALWYSTR